MIVGLLTGQSIDSEKLGCADLANKIKFVCLFIVQNFFVHPRYQVEPMQNEIPTSWKI